MHMEYEASGGLRAQLVNVSCIHGHITNEGLNIDFGRLQQDISFGGNRIGKNQVGSGRTGTLAGTMGGFAAQYCNMVCMPSGYRLPTGAHVLCLLDSVLLVTRSSYGAFW
jgi:hypothetical protein